MFSGLVLGLGACGGAECVSGPLCPGANPDPDPDPDPVATVASIAVSSPIDSVMAVGRTVQLGAIARDASGNVLSGISYAWASTDVAVASITAAGVATGISAGSTMLRATSGGVSGSVGMRAVAADLPGVTATLSDAFVPALSGVLDAGTRATLNATLSTCSGAATAGNVLAIESCVASALGTPAADGHDTAVLAVLALFFEESHRRLQLGR